MKKFINWEIWEEPLYSTEENEDEPRKFVTLITDFGVISTKLHAPLKSNLKWWVGNTNFDIGQEEFNLIDNVEGVEILSIFGPYKFRICIGHAFIDDFVKRDIENVLCPQEPKLHLDPTQILAIRHTKIDLKASGDPWLMYVLPNGGFEAFHSSKDEEYQNQLQKYREAKNTIGGRILWGMNDGIG